MGIDRRLLGAAFLTALLSFTPRLWGDTIRVPADVPGIPAALAAAKDGDAVLVAPGSYALKAPLRLAGKAIALRSEAGASLTTLTLDAHPTDPLAASLITFDGGEGKGAVLEGFTLHGGKGTGDVGGCIFCRNGSSPTLRACRIEACVSRGGGGIHCQESSAPLLEACTFLGNHGFTGGAVSCFDSSPTLVNCLIEANLAYQGSAVYVTGSGTPSLLNCTLTANVAGSVGVCYQELGASLSVQNCLVWGNHPDEPCSATGEGNYFPDLGSNPLFLRTGRFDFNRGPTPDGLPDFVIDSGDYRLQDGSPAIDSGIAAGAPAEDIDGTPRPCGRSPDAGAYEHCSSLEPAPDCNGNGVDDARDIAGGTSADCNRNGIPDECPCAGAPDALPECRGGC